MVVEALLGDGVIDRRRTVLRLLRLRETYGDERLEAACARALRFDAANYTTVKRILQEQLDQQEQPAVVLAAPARTFVRNAADLLGHLFGGVAWN
jgi:hypothetical protein